MNQSLLQFWAIVTADRKKAAMLGALVLVAGGLWVRAALTTGPSRAKAGAGGGIVTLQADGGEDEGPAEPDLRRTVTVTPAPRNTRDLFALSDALVSLSSQMEPDASGAPKSASGSDDNTQRPGARARDRERRVRDEASSLRLRSTMIGASPIAVIETPEGNRHGVVVRPGDVVEGFRVVAIRTHEVELEKDGVSVTIARAAQEH
ncbi:MAG: hypothetical protein D6693_10195 [Planctomycetota bacterium]|nr:MAG: hypothetical protein D6693_10195 [Planctomycetota bacterium]